NVSGGWQLDGQVPWCTGAAHADVLVVGAAVADSEQRVLLAVPTRLAGVTVHPPLPLVAMAATHTASVQFDGAIVPQDHLLQGPAEKVLNTRRATVPVAQAFLALGLCRGTL